MHMRACNDILLFIYLDIDEEILYVDTVSKAHCLTFGGEAILCMDSLYLLQVRVILYLYTFFLIQSIFSPLCIV